MKAKKFYIIALIIVIVDQAIKLVVKLGMEERETIPILGDFFKLHFIENKGAAFGVTFKDLIESVGRIFVSDLTMPESSSKLFLTLFSIGAVFVIVHFIRKFADHHSRLPLYLSFILGGAVGNIIDRVFYGVWFAEMNSYDDGGLFFGRVVDMFYVDIWEGQLPNWIPLIGGDYYSFWPVFNFADAAISVGIVAILIFQRKFQRQHLEWERAHASGEVTDTKPAESPDSEALSDTPEAKKEEAEETKVSSKKEPSDSSPPDDTDTYV